MQQSFAVLTAFLIVSASASSLIRRDEGTDNQCFEFDSMIPEKSTCNSRPDLVCTKGCTGGIAASGCVWGPSGNATKEETEKGRAAHPKPENVTCTKAMGKSSASSYTCRTDTDVYTCSSRSAGSATCSGCVSNGVQIGNVPATTPGANGTAMNNTMPNDKDMSNNMTSGDATACNNTAMPATNASGSGNGNATSPSSTTSSAFVVSGNMVSAVSASLFAGVASLVL
ncbi:uncharacterized protein MELLADRAFT_104816 [Melampsora larici-populina 98AG31]|uniref:Secreted protein n=1 Tax=Melampsora larici-populina (strain 98AG31 / pathotype 3-4-7) TaxID=747676 RepID=F4RG99_MELLP|nr:uncharacterized protein MELLADRAFT_104816 [Melampsora larici-populina 98AG31]EGG08703.1 secreted protein [Melampsora larici-populina 98AG31]